ncbi:unnamed protein product [Oikopleura dioica]|uniref:3CxxC-type domain-containing protein n=1 Tax=Oikopleura dioica TaxID=34765 RepID=E4XD50_OIKDI|nr:unnamed protein product [Oikopleura dioica]
MSLLGDNKSSIKRTFKCSKSLCSAKYETEDFDGKTDMKCHCGDDLRWRSRGGTVHRYFRCDECDKDYESLAYKQTKLECPGCDAELHEDKRRTKYYGKLYGQYQCSNCRKKWSSAYAFKRDFQKCTECGNEVLPHQLVEHLKDGKKGDKEHRSDLCGRCMSERPCKFANRR